jgi:hypothetical protein
MAHTARGRRFAEHPTNDKKPFGIEEKVKLPDGWLKDLGAIKKEISLLKNEAEAYKPLCKLLNKISLEVFKRRKAPSVVLFEPRNTSPPKGDYLGYKVTPDIIARNASVKDMEKRLNSKQKKGETLFEVCKE